MINYNCPKCQEPLQADDGQVGAINSCPRCKSPVQVPAKKSNLPIVLAIVGACLLLACPMCIVVSLAAIQILGTNANTTFQTVGASIGSTVSAGVPPRR